MKIIGLMTILAMLAITRDASAGMFGRRRGISRTTPIVSDLPHDGATRVKDGWHWEFRRNGPHSGTWVGTHPIGTDAGDYFEGYPRHGATRYKDGLNWTFDAYEGKWISE